jgi:antitoxin (DNA-binding transcriptional repressor) of toxin-antitoxin stability system
MPAITATELARDTRQILDRVASGERFDVLRHQAAVARLVPAQRTMTAEQAFEGLQPMLTPRDAAAWAKDSRSDLATTTCGLPPR